MALNQKRKQKKKRVTISNSEAVARLDAMSPILFKNVQAALQIEATLEVGNSIVGEMSGRNFDGARTYNRIKQSLAYDLAMHLARLYDVGHSQRHPNKLDVVSIPLAYRLLRQKRCVTALTRRARNWLPHDISFANQFEQDCSRAIERAYAVYPQVFGASNGRKSLQILKEFRDVFMAHSLMKNSNANPVYNQLFQLTDHARDFVQDVRLAVEGVGDDLREHERIFTNDARRFWSMALLGKIDVNDV